MREYWTEAEEERYGREEKIYSEPHKLLQSDTAWTHYRGRHRLSPSASSSRAYFMSTRHGSATFDYFWNPGTSVPVMMAGERYMETRGLPSGKTPESLCQYTSGLITGCYRKRTGVRRKGGDRGGEQQAETERAVGQEMPRTAQRLPERYKASKMKSQSSLCCVLPGLWPACEHAPMTASTRDQLSLKARLSTVILSFSQPRCHISLILLRQCTESHASVTHCLTTQTLGSKEQGTFAWYHAPQNTPYVQRWSNYLLAMEGKPLPSPPPGTSARSSGNTALKVNFLLSTYSVKINYKKMNHYKFQVWQMSNSYFTQWS